MQVFRSRLITGAIAALSVLAAGGTVPDSVPISVIVGSNVPAFEEAVGAFKAALADQSFRISVIKLDENGLAGSLTRDVRPRISIAFGSRAVEALISADPSLPVIVTMVIAVDQSGNAHPQKLVSTVSLSIAPAAMLAKLRSAFPAQRRLALLVTPGSKIIRSELIAHAQRLGYALEIIECSGPRDVLEVFATLRGRVDFVWCLPDNALFPAAAVAPIILASIRNRLPVVGFSESFVRAGATVGFYPDYADIGTQTADLVKKYLADQDLPKRESPRKVRMALNDRVMRILGIGPR